MIIKILTTPFLAYFATMVTVAIMGRKTAVGLFGNTVEELLLIWILIILAFWVLQFFGKKKVDKE
jgi:positive regulator of sigma E activity